MTVDLTDNDRRRLERISDAIRRADTAEANQAAEAARQAGLVHPMIATARALWLSDRERHDEALAEFRDAEAMSGAPNPALKSAIGVALAKLGRADEAVAAFRDATALQPNAPQLQMRLGWALELQGELEPARAAHERALALKPDYPEALGRLAYLATRRGDLAEARSLAERALALDIDQASAQLALATVEMDERQYGNAETRLARLLTHPKLGGHDRYVATGLIGDLYDAQGRAAEAFAQYEKANEIGRHLPGTTYGGRSMLDVVKGLAIYMDKREDAPRQKPQNAGAPVSPPVSHVFLLGFPRSGTTLLEQVLACHPNVATLEEKDTLADAIRAFFGRPEDLEKLWAAPEAELDRQRALYWNRVRSYGTAPEGKVVVDKTPINTIYLPLIARLFPDARIVFALRDPRDVVLSCFRRRFRTNALTSEFTTVKRTAQFYDAVMRLGETYRTKLGLAYFHIHHEALVDSFEFQLRKLCDFLGLDWSDAFWGFADRSRRSGVNTPSSVQLVRGLNNEGIGQWRPYRPQLEAVLPLLDPWVTRFGYPKE
ncbi:MAG TPA: sulfotransferase [Rhizomicrobium sp.]|nr:sulfotransferase [Rhizomicrobium sp.]